MGTSGKQKRDRMPINREVLEWARTRLNLSYEDAADAIGVKPQQIREWEIGPALPTVLQARKLAEAYDRPFLEFFARKKPEVRGPELLPDYRMHRDTELPREKHELIRIQADAEEIRLNAIDLFDLLGEEPPAVPTTLYAQLSEPAERAAMRAREAIELPADAQTSLKSSDRDKFPKILRTRIEDKGILVAKNSGLQHYGARGMCIYATPLPIIVFSNESPGAQAFTLAHELAHIALRQSAISGPPGSAPTSAKKIEDWCDAYAAAFLIPKAELSRRLPKPYEPASFISDSDLSELARLFAVSRHAMLVRLVNLGYVEPRYYWGTKRAQFVKEEAEYKSRGRSPYYGSRYRSSRGDMYTGLVLEAWSSGIITNHNAAEFMGIKNIAHLDDIRNRFGAA